MKKIERNKNRKSGITLISLVITIIAQVAKYQ